MNKHIELVKKWLADPESVSVEELKANKDDAWAAADSTNAWAAKEVVWGASAAAAAAVAAAGAAKAAAYWAAWAAAESADATYGTDYYRNRAIKCIEEYEELTK